MAFEVDCGSCGARFTLPQDLYERKVKGRTVTVRCKRCHGDITVDGTLPGGPVSTRPPPDETPTVPLTSTTAIVVGGLWVVSYADDDDRELTVNQIKSALERGEIDGETLVWNSSMDEWRSLSEVPELARLSEKVAPRDMTGGFLGTGVKATVTEPAMRPSNRPPPMPSAEEAALLGEDEIGPFRSESAGTFFVGDKGEGEAPKEPAAVTDDGKTTPMPPVREVKERGTAGERPPKPRLPRAPAKVKPNWMSDRPPPRARDDVDDEEEEPAPISGTPDLRALTGTVKPAEDEPSVDVKEEVSDEIFNVGGGGGIAAQIPTIDLSALPEPPPSSDRKPRRRRAEEDDEEEAPDSERPREPRAKSKAARARDAEPSRSKSERPARTADEPSGSSVVPWLVVIGIGLVAGWYVFVYQKGDASRTAPSATSLQGSEPPTTATTTTAEPETPPASAPTAPSAAPTVSSRKNEAIESEHATPREPKPEKEPTEKEPKETPTAPPPSATTSATEVAMAPPFDTAAAQAAVSSAASAAEGCRQEGDPSGTTTVIVTFAPSGRATTATVNGPPFAGTKTGGCIASAMRRAHVPAFSGGPKTVSKTIVIN